MQVREIFEDVVKDLKDDYVAMLDNRFDMLISEARELNDTVDLYRALKKISRYSSDGYNLNSDGHFVNAIMRYVNEDGTWASTARHNTKSKLDEDLAVTKKAKEIEYLTKMMFEGFINKNTAKIEAVFGDRELKTIRKSLGSSLTGEVLFEFTNGDSFLVVNTIEFAISKLGNWFNRFPTRFHNVVLSGEKMKQPSEAKMKREFANG